MQPEIKKDIVEILSTVIEILKLGETGDSDEIKELSNHTIHNASTYQDEDSIAVAVLTYALAKLIARGVVLDKRMFILIRKARDALQKDNDKIYKANMTLLFRDIRKLDEKLKLYIEHVIKHAEIKKGTKLYEHGLSMAKAAALMNINQWELMQYVGKQEIEVPFGKIDLHSRLKLAKKLFNAP